MSFRFADRVGDTGTYDSTPTPKEVDLDGTGIAGLRTFAAAVTGGDLNYADETRVLITDASDSWATYTATVTSGTPDVIELDTLIASDGVIVDEAAVSIYLVHTQEDTKKDLLDDYQAPTTVGITGVSGKRYFVDASGLTATRQILIPDGELGDRIEIILTDDAPAAYEFLITAGAGVTAIIGDTSVTNGELTRLFLRGESLVLDQVAASTWHVTHDGRVAQKCHVYGTWTMSAVSTWTTVDLAGFTTETDIGGMLDTANDRITVRRSSHYRVSHSSRLGVFPAGSGKFNYTGVAVNGTQKGAPYRPGNSGDVVGYAALSYVEPLVTSDYITALAWQNDSTSETVDTYFEVTEIF